MKVSKIRPFSGIFFTLLENHRGNSQVKCLFERPNPVLGLNWTLPAFRSKKVTDLGKLQFLIFDRF